MTASAPGDAAQRVSNLSRAYRVNLTVLALVALFTGAFLVYSVLSLSVARRAQQFARVNLRPPAGNAAASARGQGCPHFTDRNTRQDGQEEGRIIQFQHA